MFVIFLQAWKIIVTLEKMRVLIQLLRCGYNAIFQNCNLLILDIWWICVCIAPRRLHKSDVLEVTGDELGKSVHSSVLQCSAMLERDQKSGCLHLIYKAEYQTYDQFRFARTLASATWYAWESWSSRFQFMNRTALKATLQIWFALYWTVWKPL